MPSAAVDRNDFSVREKSLKRFSWNEKPRGLYDRAVFRIVWDDLSAVPCFPLPRRNLVARASRRLA
jgi:hypothetical protein